VNLRTDATLVQPLRYTICFHAAVSRRDVCPRDSNSTNGSDTAGATVPALGEPLLDDVVQPERLWTMPQLLGRLLALLGRRRHTTLHKRLLIPLQLLRRPLRLAGRLPVNSPKSIACSSQPMSSEGLSLCLVYSRRASCQLVVS
jgi:hypothetical protein